MNTKPSPSSNKEKKQSVVKQLSGLLKNKIFRKNRLEKGKNSIFKNEVWVIKY